MLVLYASLAAPNLPQSIKKLFKNNLFKIIILTLIVYQTNKDSTMAILIAIGFTISLRSLTNKKIEKFGVNYPGYGAFRYDNTKYGGWSTLSVNNQFNSPLHLNFLVSINNNYYRACMMYNILIILHPKNHCKLVALLSEEINEAKNQIDNHTRKN